VNARPASICLLAAYLCLAPGHSGAYESDQFTDRLEPLEDSTAVLDARVNESIAGVVENWWGTRNERRVVEAIYHDLGGHHWVDRIERWAMESDAVDRTVPDRKDTIYQGHPIWATRVAGLFGVSPTIKVNGVRIGSDKLGHFFSQGRKFWRRYQKSGDEMRAAERSAYTERALFGQMTTGSYSNADLVANFEGYRFYRSLFDDDIVPGKPAVLAWVGDHWEIQRVFTFADHVNDYWDEALNVNHFDSLLYPYMRQRLLGYCDDYGESPTDYSIAGETSLADRYGHLQLRDTTELQLGNLCSAEGPGVVATEVAAEPR
jgi:hypothetical protein